MVAWRRRLKTGGNHSCRQMAATTLSLYNTTAKSPSQLTATALSEFRLQIGNLIVV
ncbi:hypothetical protein HanRHA438_Chr13g0582101 [Helianthus annuus]|nr:hypothetical protein HanIR_Chr13g0621741 [Helianthus annuus]KAJ0856757.1 hypothetical protein HanRHA438_Chr13g0582101 [Helianthus annuus]